MSKRYFPMFIDISDKKIVMIGGGMIAERRVKALLYFAENITVIAPEITAEIQKLADDGRIVWKKMRYVKEVLDGADFVLAVTDDADCNEQIVLDCQKQGIMVNTSHKKELCDFYFPGTVIDDDIVVGISSSGQDHTKVKTMRELIEETLEINREKR